MPAQLIDSGPIQTTYAECSSGSVGDVYENDEAHSGSMNDKLANVVTNTDHPELYEGAQYVADHATGSNGVANSEEFGPIPGVDDSTPESITLSPLPGCPVEGFEDSMAGAVMPCTLEHGLVHTLSMSPPKQEHCDLVAISQGCNSWLLFPLLLLIEDERKVLLKRPMVGLKIPWAELRMMVETRHLSFADFGWAAGLIWCIGSMLAASSWCSADPVCVECCRGLGAYCLAVLIDAARVPRSLAIVWVFGAMSLKWMILLFELEWGVFGNLDLSLRLVFLILDWGCCSIVNAPSVGEGLMLSADAVK
ncbi:hypothetical protein Nepgr_018722 [Nepenthes gracilis]|uniref:Uncharacterized protein n=1 Tax=Nepenthes gracilis TaxID=150966 RepID=A0AAD3SVR2_NEPGR|nr:hypothetical protein Nepgr_018722 [Nepenthes gracilis]